VAHFESAGNFNSSEETNAAQPLAGMHEQRDGFVSWDCISFHHEPSFLRAGGTSGRQAPVTLCATRKKLRAKTPVWQLQNRNCSG
jgi:hypothetical protein